MKKLMLMIGAAIVSGWCMAGSEPKDSGTTFAKDALAPNPAEMTAQTYLALIHGMTSIMYLAQISQRTDTLQQIGVLGKEIKLLEPMPLRNWADFAA